MADTRHSLCGKMLAAHLAAIKDGIFKPCLRKSQTPIFQCLNPDGGQAPEWCEVAEGGERGLAASRFAVLGSSPT